MNTLALLILAEATAVPLISLLIWLLVFCLVVYLIFFIMGRLALPEPVGTIITVIVALILLVVLLRQFAFI